MATIRDCRRVQPLLSEYVDGVLPENEAWEVKMHVASCRVCAQIADDFSATARLLQSAPLPELSANFEAQLARRLADVTLKPVPTTPWDRFRGWWSEAGTRLFPSARFAPVLATGAALVAVLVPMTFVILNNGSRPRPVAASPTPGAGIRPETMTLDEVVNAHKRYESTEPLASDPSDLLPSTSLAASTGEQSL